MQAQTNLYRKNEHWFIELSSEDWLIKELQNESSAHNSLAIVSATETSITMTTELSKEVRKRLNEQKDVYTMWRVRFPSGEVREKQKLVIGGWEAAIEIAKASLDQYIPGKWALVFDDDGEDWQFQHNPIGHGQHVPASVSPVSARLLKLLEIAEYEVIDKINA